MESLMTRPQQLETEINEEVKVAEEMIELVIPPAKDAIQLFKFMYQFSNELEDNGKSGKYAKLLHTHGTWERGNVITISLFSNNYDQFLERLSNIIEVRAIEEEPLINLAFLDLPNIPNSLPSSGIRPHKRMHLVLREIAKKSETAHQTRALSYIY